MSKKCMILETLSPVTEMKKEISENRKEIRLSGVFGVCGVRNNNRRIYSKENYGQMVECLQQDIMERGVLGELEHPESMNINLNNVSHKIESVEMNEDGTVTGTIVLLDTTKGKDAKAIVESGVPLYISSRALGSIDSNGTVTLTKLATYDLVGTPGFSQAKLSRLAESGTTYESLNESCLAIFLESEDEDKDKEKEEKKEEKPTKDDESNKKDNDKVNMKDLKDAVDTLIEKVDKLEADLHVAQESLQAKDNEIQTLKESIEKTPTVNYQAIEKWVLTEFGPKFKESVLESAKEWTSNDYSKLIESWITSEFAPIVEKWVIKEFAPVLEGWTIKEFAPMVEEWITKEYSPVVEGWVTKEFGQVLENWTVTEFGKKINEWVESEVVPSINKNVSEFLECQKAEDADKRFENIDRLLEAIQAPAAPAAQILTEQQNADKKFASFPAIMNMPNQYRPMWEMLDESRKEEVAMMSRAYDFTKNGVLESFWAGIDFSKKNPSEAKITESAQPTNSLANNIVAAMMRMRTVR